MKNENVEWSWELTNWKSTAVHFFPMRACSKPVKTASPKERFLVRDHICGIALTVKILLETSQVIEFVLTFGIDCNMNLQRDFAHVLKLAVENVRSCIFLTANFAVNAKTNRKKCGAKVPSELSRQARYCVKGCSELLRWAKYHAKDRSELSRWVNYCAKGRSEFSRWANYRAKSRNNCRRERTIASKFRAVPNNRCHDNSLKFWRNIASSEIIFFKKLRKASKFVEIIFLKFYISLGNFVVFFFSKKIKNKQK